jgi:hypothetical protein
MRSLLLPIFFVLFTLGASAEQEHVTCVGSKGIAATTNVATLPAELRASLEMLAPGLGQPVPVAGGPRFIEAFHRGDHWAVAYEAADERSSNDRVAIFDLSNGRAVLRRTWSTPANGVCGNMVQLLSAGGL